MAQQFVFGEFRLDARERRLTRERELVRLEPKSFDLLYYLLEHAGSLVKKQELADAVWAQAVVTDNSLTRCIHQVRAALHDDADSPEYIETVPGSGYRFIAPVVQIEDPASVSIQNQSPHRRFLRVLPLVLMIMVALAGIVWIGFEATRVSRQPIERLAILPLVNLTGDPDQQYFVQGIHEALIAELSQIEKIDVISRTSVMQYQNTDKTVPEIAGELDVDAIVEGSVLRAGDSLAITAQLIAAAPERHLWAERYHRNVGNVFEITTEIANSVASEIAVELSPEEATLLSTARSVNAEAYDAYLLARFHFEQRTPDGYQQAQNLFRHATETDPDFAPAYAGLAHTFGSAAIFGLQRPADSMPMARTLAEKALGIDGALGEAHMILAGVDFYWDWDWAEAERRVRRVLALNPNSAHAYRLLSEILSVTGRHEDALVAIERGRGLDPLPPTSQIKPALILYLKRNYEEAIKRTRAGLEFYPEFWQGHWLLCLSFSAMGNHVEAIAACEASAGHSRRTPMALAALGYVYAMGGKREAAEQILAELEALNARRYVGAASFAMIHGALGNSDLAFEWLQRAYKDRDQLLVHVENYGFFDPLRSDERFRALHEAAFPRVDR